MRTALLTRNARAAMEIVLERFRFRFDLAWSRERGAIKPDPAAVLAVCRELNVQPERTVSVGDFRYDVEAANAAGAVSVLLARNHRPDFADQADYVIKQLAELPEILRS
jgi:HAD superfamily hydrolase (TIGR01509 family)